MTPTSWNKFVFNLELWLTARSLPFLVGKKSLAQALALTNTELSSRYAWLTPDYLNRRIKRVVRGPYFMRNRRCLRIGILGFRFLRKAGYQPELHFGLAPDSIGKARIEAHCWVCLGGEPVVGEPLDNMMTIHIHPQMPTTPKPTVLS